MSVNTYRVIDFIMPFLPEPIGDSMVLAQRHLNELVAAYDALAPDWSRAPDDAAQWYTIDANGAATWSDEEPFFSSAGKFPETFWDVNGDYYPENEPINLPLGIDWRLCKWSRPEVTK